jgi:hypothetical protein
MTYWDARSPRAERQPEYELPSVRAWADRVGATQKNFRRYVVEEEDGRGYGRTLATLSLRDGKVSCDDDEYAPTEAERAAIEASLATASFPTSASTLRGSRPEALAGEDHENIFWFTDPSGKHVSFLQCRRNGEKPDLPWSYWSDGKWRMMEPDGPLPLYGLDQIRHLNPLDRKSPIAWPRRGVMIHEGAKTAARVHDFVHENPSIDHPWKGDLRHYAHLGFPGGIYNVHRVDWSPIKRLAPGREVVVAADHDRGGERAAAEISSIIRRSMKVVMFDTNFPDAFDLADPWPKPRTFWQGARYCGPTLDDFTFPATWATKLTDVPGVKKPVATATRSTGSGRRRSSTVASARSRTSTTPRASS